MMELKNLTEKQLLKLRQDEQRKLWSNEGREEIEAYINLIDEALEDLNQSD